MANEELREAQKLWAGNKYLVLSKSHPYYLKIRDYLKREDADSTGVQRFIDKALSLEESQKDVVNAYQHIWGYFKDDAKEDEKEEFFLLLDVYKQGVVPKEEVLKFLYELLCKYPYEYLENATIFDSLRP